MPATKVTLTGGAFQDAEGNVLANGTLKFVLSQDANITGVGNLASGITVTVQLDASGNVAASQQIWGNDQMSPVNCYYRVTGYTAAGQPAWGPNNQQVVGNGGTFSLSTWIPNQVISWSPSVQSVALQTNEVANGSQTLLDLHAGSGVTLTDNGLGRVTIAGSAALALKTNGTPNGSQSILNLENGGNIGITDDGVGGITIAATIPRAFSPVRRFGSGQWTNGAVSSVGLGTNAAINFNAPTLTSQFSSVEPPGEQYSFLANAVQWAYGSFQTTLLGWPVGRSLYAAGSCRVNDSTTANSTTARIYPVWLYDQAGSGGTVFFSSLGTEPSTNGKSIGFYGYTNGGTANWQAYCSTGGVKTAVDTGVLIDTNFHFFEVIGNAGGTSFQFKIDGNVVATITTNIPASTTLMCLYHSGVQNTSATNPAMKINFHFHYVECQ